MKNGSSRADDMNHPGASRVTHTKCECVRGELIIAPWCYTPSSYARSAQLDSKLKPSGNSQKLAGETRCSRPQGSGTPSTGKKVFILHCAVKLHYFNRCACIVRYQFISYARELKWRASSDTRWRSLPVEMRVSPQQLLSGCATCLELAHTIASRPFR